MSRRLYAIHYSTCVIIRRVGGHFLVGLAMSDVTQILSQIEDGDGQAAEKLLPLVYDELRKLAAAKMAQENPGQTLQATALVMRRTFGWWMWRRPSIGIRVAISLPLLPRPCGEFSSTTHVTRDRSRPAENWDCGTEGVE